MTQNPKVFFYVQHLLGIGHLARASRIAQALVDDGFAVTMVTGGTAVAGFPGPGIDHVSLPTVTSGDAGFSGLADGDGKPVDDAYMQHRRDLLLAAFAVSQPDIIVIEAFPFGRRQVRMELLALLDAAKALDRPPRIVTSLRDILQERTKPGRDEETVALIDTYFDRILVHGDPSFARIEDTFRLAGAIADKVVYTGLVAAPAPEPPTETFEVIISAGGGAVGIDLIRAAVAAKTRLPDSGQWCLITGPNLPEADFQAITAAAPASISLFRFRRDFASLLAGCRLSVSQAGYNTVCDILRAGCQSLLIPFTAGGETEQTVRAERLQGLGLATMLTEQTLSIDTMTDAIRTILSAPPPPPHSLDLDGASHTARILRTLL